ncbi:MAG TPA: hypothetical protein VMP68_10360, partial [Candidatus Eisenbacteria bacterium]|nr:hypothetical protein [Candidatus Eisenbacteria bacterium]
PRGQFEYGIGGAIIGGFALVADLGSSFSLVENRKKAPITRKLLQQLAVRTAIPFVPIIIFGTPTGELIQAAMKLIM